MRPSAHIVTGIAASLVTFYVTAFLPNSSSLQVDSPILDILYAAAVLSLTMAAGWLVIRKLRKRWPWSLPSIPSWAWSLIIAGYLATWIFGIPAVQAHDGDRAMAHWKHNKASGYDAYDAPSVTVVAAVPLMPGFIVSYQYVNVGPLDNWHGWSLHLWYGRGVASLTDLTLSGW